MLGEPAPVAAPRYGAAPDSLMTPPACKGSFDNGNASADELFFAAQAPPTDAPSAATDPPVSGDEWDMLAGVGCTPPSRAEAEEEVKPNRVAMNYHLARLEAYEM